MISRKVLRTQDIKMFVLDEADEMLSRGFKDQIYDVFRNLNSNIQVSAGSRGQCYVYYFRRKLGDFLLNRCYDQLKSFQNHNIGPIYCMYFKRALLWIQNVHLKVIVKNSLPFWIL
jgi:hypothetical protein